MKKRKRKAVPKDNRELLFSQMRAWVNEEQAAEEANAAARRAKNAVIMVMLDYFRHMAEGMSSNQVIPVSVVETRRVVRRRSFRRRK